MALTRAQMAALLPDNTTGDISAADMRSIVLSCLTLTEEGAKLRGTYDYKKVKDQVTTSDAYAPLVSMATPAREAGTYEIKISSTFTYNTTGKSAFFRWSIDGGTNWEEFSVEPKDVTDKKALSYDFPYEHLGGAIDIRLEFKCESASNTLTVLFANLVFEQK